MRKALMLMPMIVIMAACVHAQQGKVGGTGGAGGTAGWQNGNRPALYVSTTSLPDGTANVAYSQTLAAGNGIGNLTWTIMLGQLPAGLSINSSTGVISGTPTTPGVNTFTVLVTDSASPTAQTATKQFSLNINCAPLQQTSTSPLPAAASGIAYSFQFQSLGGLGTITWAQTGAPSGITLSSAGLLSGTTTAVGTSTITVTATDLCPVPQSIQVPYSFTVNAGLTITTSSPLNPAVTGSAYQVTLTSQGGTAPYTWALGSGSLPAGLSLSAGGVISGTPTGVGTSSFTVNVTDSALATTSAPLTITVSCVPLSVTSGTTLPNATQGQPYNFQFTSSGGNGTISWSVATGTSLPNGLSLSNSGLLSGTPTLGGSYSFDISAADSCPIVQQDGNTFSLTVGNGLTITTNATLPGGVVGTAYSTPLAVTGGTSPYFWSAPAGTIPAGAEDILDYASMNVTDRYAKHLSATGLYKAYRIDAGLLWWLKNSQGYPWDGELIGPQYISQWFTEMDSSQNAACQARGWPSCFSDPKAYKKYRTPVPLWARYHVPGADDVVFTPGPNLYDLTVNCGEDNQTPIDNKGVRGELTGPFTDVAWQTTYGGSIPDGTPYLLAQKWIKCTANDITTCQNEEDYWLVKGYGQVRWCPKTWNGVTYVTGTCTTQTNVVAGGAPTPNFACKVPNYPTPDVSLPPGITSANATQMTINDSTGVISGTPSQTGNFAFTVQVEDALGAITQKAMTLNTGCPVMSLSSTSPLPNATQGQAYSFQFAVSGGLSPISWTVIQGTLPAGLTLSSSGLLSGTPTASGTFHFVPQALDSCAPQQQSVQNQFAITVQANTGVLTIQTSSPLSAATEGQAYNTNLSATGGTTPYAWSVSSGSLPAGLTLASATGVISGTPTATGTASFTAKVTDALTVFTTKAFNLTVSCVALSLVSTSPLPAATQGQSYSFQFTSAGGTGAVTWGATGLPAGLTLSSGGLLSGTPTGTGTSTPSVTATDSCSPTPQTANGSFSITITATPPPISITTSSPLAAATQGVSYNTQMAATGGTPPYGWSITSGSLPAGLTLSSGGLISGTPTTIGTSTPTIKVTDSLGANASGSFSITVSCTALSISTASLPVGTQNSPYSFQMSKSGGTGAVTWSLAGGSFPTGVSISSAGLISGTPSASGAFNPQIQVTDACSTPQTATTTFSLTINPAIVPLQITTTSVPPATQNQAYSVTLSATGGTPPYGSWTVTVGSLPTGLSLGSSTGVISGTPSGTGTSNFTVRVSDNVAATATQALSITVNSATGADNRYCNTNNQVIGLSADSFAAPLSQCMNTALSSTPSNGTIRGPVNNASTFNTAYTAAACGDIIQITAGSVITGPITLTAKNCNAGHWITIESTGISNPSFPPEGTRLTPCAAAVASLPQRPAYPCSNTTNLMAAFMATSGNNAVRMNGADHIRFIGIEFTRVSTPHASISALVDLGSAFPTAISSWFVFDRTWFAGIEGFGTFPQSTTTDTSTSRGVFLAQANHVAIIDSYMSNFYDNGSVSSNGQTDAQCVSGGVGSKQLTGWGVYKFVNNHCEGGSEGFILGGGGGPALTPTGCTKGVTCTLDVPTDIEIRRNYFFAPNFWNGNTTTINTAGWPNRKNGMEFKSGARILIEGNVFENCWYVSQPYCYVMDYAPKNQMNTATDPGGCPSCLVQDAVGRYNYAYNYSGPHFASYTSSFVNGCAGCGQTLGRRLVFHDNLVGDKLNRGQLTLTGFDGIEFLVSAGPLTQVAYFHNTIVNVFRSFMFIGANAPGQIDQLVIQDNLTYLGTQVPGGVIPATATGCDKSGNNFLTILNNCVNGTTPTWTVNHNGTFGAPATGWPTGNLNVSTAAGVGFVNYNNADSGFNPGNYALTNVSPFHNAASDGKDIGANIPLLLQMIAGVRQ